MVNALSTPSFALFDELRSELAADPAMVALRQEVLEGSHTDKWAVIDDIVMVDGRIFVTATSPCVPHILAGAHGVGHEGVQKTLHHVCANFFIPGTRALVQDFVHACTTCQWNKIEQLHPAGLL
jgi:hypothetical protein